MITTGFQLFSLVFIDYHWFSSFFIGFNVFSWIVNDFQRCSLMFIELSLSLFGLHGFALLFIESFIDVHWLAIDVQWFSYMFKENRASLGQPSAPWGWVLNNGKSLFRVKLLARNRTSVPAPSAAFGPPPWPSAACGWVLRYRTVLPPHTPPDFYSSNVDVVGVVGVVLTRGRESVGFLWFPSLLLLGVMSVDFILFVLYVLICRFPYFPLF